MDKQALGIIGTGKMGEALIKGLISSAAFSKDKLVASEPDRARREAIASRYGINVFADNESVVSQAATVILAVKPQAVDMVLEQLKESFSPDHLLISIVAGVGLARLRRPFSKGPRLIRVMPNACVMAQAGASVIYPGPGITAQDEELALNIFNSVGKAFIIKNEELMDAVTGLSGSGPAYFFVVFEALSDAGVAQGLPRELALELAVQTALGAAKLAQESGLHPARLKEVVTSPAGTTIAGLKRLERFALRSAFMEAVDAATKRSKELGRD
jgi:pyrroline-5-carboxylate reductase